LRLLARAMTLVDDARLQYLNGIFHCIQETKNMKRTYTLLALLLALSATVAFAQRAMDSANERAVRIVDGPRVDNITGHSATLDWTTNSAGANHVRYRVAGSNQPWRSAYHPGGGTHHSLQLTGLEPGRTYEWQILTRDGDLRKEGRFQTGGHGDRDHDRDHDGDHDHDRP
jgi:hypothetical protein